MYRRLLPGVFVVLILACSPQEASDAPLTTSIPDAILGAAPPPSGENVMYLEGDEATPRAWLPAPKHSGCPDRTRRRMRLRPQERRRP